MGPKVDDKDNKTSQLICKTWRIKKLQLSTYFTDFRCQNLKRRGNMICLVNLNGNVENHLNELWE